MVVCDVTCLSDLCTINQLRVDLRNIYSVCIKIIFSMVICILVFGNLNTYCLEIIHDGEKYSLDKIHLFEKYVLD